MVSGGWPCGVLPLPLPDVPDLRLWVASEGAAQKWLEREAEGQNKIAPGT